MESQSIFQAKTQAKNFSIESLPCCCSILLLPPVAVLELQVSLQLLGAAVHGGAAVLALLVGGGGAGCRHAGGGRLSVLGGSFWKHTMTFKSAMHGSLSTVTDYYGI